jgi:serine/threonine-protein kinase
VVRFEFEAAEGVSVVSECCGPQQALSPNGEWFVYTGNGGADGRDPLFRRRLGRLEAEEIGGTDGASMPAFSPDGQWLAFWSDGRLRKVAMTGGPPVPIADIDIPAGIAWNDDDIIVVAGGLDGPVQTLPASGGTPTLVPNTGPEDNYNHPSPIPGGGAVLIRSGSTADARVVALDLDTGASDTLAFGTRGVFAAGHLVISSSDGTLLTRPFDPGKRETLGPAAAILDGVGTAGPGMGEFALSATGLAFQTRSRGFAEIIVIDGPTGPQEVPLTNTGNLEGPTISPDGRKIAFQIADGEVGIWLWDRDQLTQQLLVPDGASPVWSADGSRIAFRAAGDDGARIDWAPVDGSGQPETLLEPDHPVTPASFSPDDSVLAFIALRDGDGDADIGFLEIAKGEVRWFVEDDANETQPIISPDGRWVAYTSDRSGQREVYVRAFDGTGGRTQISAGGGTSPRWAPDGSAVYYSPGEGQTTTVVTVAVTDDNLRVLRREDGFAGIQDINLDVEVNWDIGPDGSEFVYISRGGVSGRPAFVWILNWPEIVRGMASGT